MTTGGTFSQLAQRKLYHLATDQEGLARLNESQLLRGGVTEDVQIDPTDEQ